VLYNFDQRAELSDRGIDNMVRNLRQAVSGAADVYATMNEEIQVLRTLLSDFNRQVSVCMRGGGALTDIE
jgi:hypothetical protein